MNSFKLTALGSLAAMPSSNKNQSAHILNVYEQIFLLDAAEGVQKQLKRYDFNSLKINNIFITHIHGDHFYGIYGLISTMSLMGRKHKLTIFGPSPISSIISNHCALFEPHLSYPIECREVDTAKQQLVFENKVLEVFSLPLRHKIPTVGYFFKEKPPRRNIHKHIIERYNLEYVDVNALKDGRDVVLEDSTILESSKATYQPYAPRSFAYITDTAPSKEVAAAIRGVDLLFHEATFLERDKRLAMATMHSTTKDAAYIATQSEAKKLLIGHFSLRYKSGDKEYLSEINRHFTASEIAIEGKTYDI